jgi:dTDP-3-amino-3,4,6-trideoxy-alpha-D-glucose transaminase
MLPTASPRASYSAHSDEIDEALRRVAASGHYILGPEVEAFEAEFAAYIGVKHCIGVANGTDALRLAIQATIPFRGAEGITVSMTATATVAAIAEAGWQPQLIDISAADYTMDMAALEQALTAPGMFIVPVHLYGYPCRMDEIGQLAQSRQAFVIEDCAQSHGAIYKGRRVGSFGIASAFSFYPTKNLGALGDGGALLTDSDEIAGQARLLRMYGWKTRYISELHGINSRLDEIQAAVLRVKLRYLDSDNARRSQIAEMYSKAFAGLDLQLPPHGGVFHQYVVRHPRRDALQQGLANRLIDSRVLYPVPIHLQPAYADSPPLDLPVTEEVARTLLCLPIYPEMLDIDVERVCQGVAEVVRSL